ncbi:MAG: prolipoprotein diacylglyceryl transferase [Prevotellaceae bacterium]|nr:prolipoprotein diacylglyceryl transferase [Prevotellaceae bacterium]
MIYNFDPVIFNFLPTRWYTLLFLLGFVVCLWVFDKILQKQGYAEHKNISNNFFVFAIAGTIIGARLGHVFFYAWDYYSHHILEIFEPWKGGLASHGGVAGVFLATIIFFKIYGKKYNLSLWKIFDALIIPALLMSAFIRFGNFCNSEIVGIQTKSDKGIVFCGDIYYACDRSDMPDIYVEKTGEASDGFAPITCRLIYDKPNDYAAKTVFFNLMGDSDNLKFDNFEMTVQQVDGKWEYSKQGMGILRHPAQLYECLFYLFLFVVSLFAYKRLFAYKGLCFALFLGLIFLFRFFIEFIKMEQIEAEKEMAINIGQKLSIPIIVICFVVALWRYFKVILRTAN